MTTNFDPSTLTAGQEHYTYYKDASGHDRVQYDYRDPADGDLFSCVSLALQFARHRRDEWLADRHGDERRATKDRRKPYNNTHGYVRSARCHAPCGGWIVLYDRVKGFDDGGAAMEKVLRFRLQHEPSKMGANFSRRTDANKAFTFAVKGELEAFRPDLDGSRHALTLPAGDPVRKAFEAPVPQAPKLRDVLRDIRETQKAVYIDTGKVEAKGAHWLAVALLDALLENKVEPLLGFCSELKEIAAQIREI